MKKISIVLCLCLLAYFSYAQPNLKNFDYISTWSDDFTSTSMNNAKWWNYHITYAENSVWKPENVSYGQAPSMNGANDKKVCKIYTKYVSTPQKGVTWEDSVRKEYYSRQTCGRVVLNSKCRYGYYETNMKEPASDVKICSSFWFWSSNGEIDVQENTSNNDIGIAGHTVSKSIIRNAIRYDALGDKNKWSPLAVDIPVTNPYGGALVDLTQEFHTYGVDWTPDYIDFYFDGDLITHVPNGQNGLEIEKMNPMLMAIWTKVPSKWNELPESENSHNRASGIKPLEVDYFRYYKHKPLLASATYNSASNSILFTVDSKNLDDTYRWSVGNGTSVSSVSGNRATIKLPSGCNVFSVNISASSAYPQATSSSSFTINKNTSLSGSQANNTVVVVASNSVTLSPGFEVKLGNSFSILK